MSTIVWSNNKAYRKNLDADIHWLSVEFPNKHDHDYWEFFVVTKHKCRHYLNGQMYVMNPNDAYLLRPKDEHYILKYDENSFSHINLSFKDEAAKKWCDLIAPGFYEQLLADPPLFYHLGTSQMDKIVRYTVTLQAAIRQNNLSIIPVISHCFISFVLEMVAEKYHIDTISHYPDWLNDLIFEINKPENISAFPHDIVAKCNFSKTYIARTFKFYTGKTLIEYMTDVKIKHACDCLIQSQMNILEIASALGFNSLSHFNHLFKKHLGISPKQYAQKYKNKFE